MLGISYIVIFDKYQIRFRLQLISNGLTVILLNFVFCVS